MLQIAKQDEVALQHVAPLEAAEQNGYALEHAAPEHRAQVPFFRSFGGGMGWGRTAPPGGLVG